MQNHATGLAASSEKSGSAVTSPSQTCVFQRTVKKEIFRQFASLEQKGKEFRFFCFFWVVQFDWVRT